MYRHMLVLSVITFGIGALSASTEAKSNLTSAFRERMEALLKKRIENAPGRAAKCELSGLRVSSGLDIKKEEAIIAEDCVAYEPESARITLKCAPGFTATGDQDGETKVTAECKDRDGNYQWISEQDMFGSEPGKVVLGCHPIVCKEGEGLDEQWQRENGLEYVDWRNDHIDTQNFGVLQSKYMENLHVHGGRGKIKCKDGYSTDGDVKSDDSENGFFKLTCYKGELFLGVAEVPSFDSDAPPNQGIKKKTLTCSKIERKWPPQPRGPTGVAFQTPRDDGGPSLVEQLTSGWEVVKFTWETWIFNLKYDEEAPDYFCSDGYSLNPEDPEQKRYKVGLDKNGNYQVEHDLLKSEAYEDIEALMRQICKPILCKDPKDPSGPDGAVNAKKIQDKNGMDIELPLKYDKTKYELRCQEGYSFDGEKHTTEEHKTIECSTRGVWEGIERCISNQCDELKHAGDSTKTDYGKEITVKCPKGHSFTGSKTELKPGEYCGGATPCEKRLKCSDDHIWIDENEDPCKKEGKDLCACTPISCGDPYTREGENMIIEQSPNSGATVFLDYVTFKCNRGFSFSGEKECDHEVSTATYVCKHDGSFTKDQTRSCPKEEGKLDTILTTEKLPGSCSRIKKYCEDLPGDRDGSGDWSGFAKRGTCTSFFEAKCTFECSQITETVGSKLRSCLKNHEELTCGGDGQWKFDNTNVPASTSLEVVTKACKTPANLLKCDKIDALHHNANFDNQPVKSKYWDIENSPTGCGTRVDFHCFTGYQTKDKKKVLTFECAKPEKDGGKLDHSTVEWQFVNGNGELETLNLNNQKCEPEGCGDFAKAEWYSGTEEQKTFYGALFKLNSEQTQKKRRRTNQISTKETLTCQWWPSGEGIDSEKYKKCWPKLEENMASYCHQGEWSKPDGYLGYHCAFPLLSNSGALSMDTSGDVTVSTTFKKYDIAQRWVFQYGNLWASQNADFAEDSGYALGMKGSLDKCMEKWKGAFDKQMKDIQEAKDIQKDSEAKQKVTLETQELLELCAEAGDCACAQKIASNCDKELKENACALTARKCFFYEEECEDGTNKKTMTWMVSECIGGDTNTQKCSLSLADMQTHSQQNIGKCDILPSWYLSFEGKKPYLKALFVNKFKQGNKPELDKESEESVRFAFEP